MCIVAASDALCTSVADPHPIVVSFVRAHDMHGVQTGRESIDFKLD